VSEGSEERVLERRILCPRCGRYVTSDLYYALHYFGLCLEALPFEYEER
jgi:hypothetical protein